MNRPSTISLVAANLLMALFVVSQRWGYYSVILIYWFEAMIIGVYGLARMCVACWFGNPLGKWIGMKDGASRFMLSLFLGWFYIVKFGGVAVGMGLLVALTPGFLTGDDGGDGLRAIAIGLENVGASALIAAAMFFVSHGVSFVYNFIGHNEYRHSNAIALLFRPYLRMVLVLVVLAGGFGAAFAFPELHRTTAFAAGIVLIKLLADVVSHYIEHGRPRSPRLQPTG
ncbi:MAG: DUF6498-containing protein [bacterium]